LISTNSNADLRRLVREALDRIEISVRAVITYEIGKDLGVFGYADRANFAAAFNHADFMKILRREEGRSTEVFIGHYRTKYTSETDLPVWMATELISFGALSKMYEHLRTSLRKKNRPRIQSAAAGLCKLASLPDGCSQCLRASQPIVESRTCCQAGVACGMESKRHW